MTSATKLIEKNYLRRYEQMVRRTGGTRSLGALERENLRERARQETAEACGVDVKRVRKACHGKP